MSISILMPIYNGIEFIHDSVTSVIQQSYPSWELHIGINGHPRHSETYQLAKQYEQLDHRIHVHELYPIVGKSNALNAMVELCKSSQYIAILDVDDIWHPEKLAQQVPYMPHYDVIGTWCVLFGETKEGVVPNIPANDFTLFDFRRVNPIINSSVLIRKPYCYWDPIFEGIEDYELWIRLFKLKCSFFNVPNLLVKHRIHQNSAFNSKNNHLKVQPMLSHHFDKMH